jgi:hydrogenase nickel insertion protein HypA
MHEYGLVQSILSLVDQSVRMRAGKRAVRVEVGVEGGAVEERSLRDAFDTFKVATTARDAELVVVCTPLEVWCLDCATKASVPHGHDHDLTCPTCGGPAVRVSSESEIYLKSVEIEV